MNRFKIISLGEVLWDVFPDGEQFGGAPANFACHAAIAGADVSIVSAVGDDDRGHKATAILEENRIDVSLLQVVPDAETGTVGVDLDDEGRPTFTIHEDAAWDRIAWTGELESRIGEADAIYFGTLGQRGKVSRDTIRRAVKAAEAAGVPRVLDINLRRPFFDSELIRESVEHTSIVKLSDEELGEVCAACGVSTSDEPETLLCRLRTAANLDLAVMTLGAEGAVLATPQGTVRQPGIPTDVRDTVGEICEIWGHP